MKKDLRCEWCIENNFESCTVCEDREEALEKKEKTLLIKALIHLQTKKPFLEEKIDNLLNKLK